MIVLSLEQDSIEIIDENRNLTLVKDKEISRKLLHEFEKKLAEQTFTSEEIEVNIKIDRNMVLSKIIALPKNTQENLHEVVQYEMDRYTPFQAEDVYFDCVVEGKTENDDLIKVQLYVIKKEILQPIVNFIKEKNIRLNYIDIIDPNNSENSISNINLLRSYKSKASRNGTIQKLMWLVIGLIFLTAFTPIVINYIYINKLEKELEALQPKINEVKKLQKEYENMLSHVGYLVEKKERYPSIIKLLDAITQATPDHTFVKRLTLEEGSLTLQGLSQSASELIPILDEIGLFKDIRFTAPVTQSGDNNLERYSISATLVSFQDKNTDEF